MSCLERAWKGKASMDATEDMQGSMRSDINEDYNLAESLSIEISAPIYIIYPKKKNNRAASR
jgi:hypothetical protein